MTDENLTSITEQIGDPVSAEERQRLYDRYVWVRERTRDADVVEAACGTGQGIAFLRPTVRSIRGTDLSPSNVAVGRRIFGEDLPVTAASAVPIDAPDRSLDRVVILEALYFLPDAGAFIAEAFRVLRPGGELLLTVNNRNSLNFSPSWMGVTYFGVGELHQALADAGFEPAIFGGCRISPGSDRRQLLLAPVKRVVQGLGLTPRNKRLRQFVKQVMYGKARPLAPAIPEDHPHPELQPLDPARAHPEFKILYAAATKP